MKINQYLCLFFTCAVIYSGSSVVTHAQMYYIYSYGFICYNPYLKVGGDGGWVNYDTKAHWIRSDLPRSDPDYFEAYLSVNGPSIFHTFNHGGTFTFHDDFSSYTGSFIVMATPTVTITNPPNGAVFLAPVSFDLQAVATDAGRVQFFVDTALIGTATSKPYTVHVDNLTAGNRVLTAIATDAIFDLPEATNSVSITVAPPIEVQHSRLLGGQFVFDAHVVAGWQTVLETSSDLSTWVAIRTNIASSTLQTFTNTLSTGRKFYRVAQRP